MMYNLIGIREEYTPTYDGGYSTATTREIVATFDTAKMAKDYIKKSKLKNPKRNTWSSDTVFKSKSLLGYYTFTEIEEHEDIVVPHNPK